MPEVTYQALTPYLEEAAKVKSLPVFLIWGEESLCKTATRRLVHVLLPEGKQHFNFESLDGSDENIATAVQRANTYALIGGGRVILLAGANLFHAGRDRGELPDKVRQAFDRQDMSTAGRLLLRLLAVEKLSIAESTPTDLERIFKSQKNAHADLNWLAVLVDYCRRQEMDIRLPNEGAAELLLQAVESGFPSGNQLILTAERVHRGMRLYRRIVDRGAVIDCSVPQGSRMADKKIRQAVLEQKAQAMLSAQNKHMDAQAMAALQEMTGFDLRTFANNLDKLISYVGERKDIQAADIRQVLSRTRKDPLYDFTDAVSRRSLDRALFLLNSLLADGMHPLQLHMALVNQVRKLLVAKDFIKSAAGAAWKSTMNYTRFQKEVMPALKKFDGQLENLQQEWDQALASQEKSREKKTEKKKRQAGAGSTLTLSGAHAYTVFLLLQKCGKYKQTELIDMLRLLQRIEMRLKRTGGHPQRLLEAALFQIRGMRARNAPGLSENRQPLH